MTKEQDKLLAWYHSNKRNLPWRNTDNPYHIWLSEIMLQQTRVESVKGYYARFLDLFPTVEDLADAPEEKVLKAWEGLGYYSRARNLHKAAKIIGGLGRFPSTYDELLALPGIGAYTAGAVASIAFGQSVPAVDGNVNRVISRLKGIREDISYPAVQKQIRKEAQRLLENALPGEINQALMELGATVCIPVSPKCSLCPWNEYCDAFTEGDMELLPVHEKKRPQKVIPLVVGLVTYNRKILVLKRNQRMLKGMYVFLLTENETTTQHLEQLFKEMDLRANFRKKLGEGRHVFTHRIWEMQFFHFELSQEPSSETLDKMDCFWADAAQLHSLPFPTAMKDALKHAFSLLEEP